MGLKETKEALRKKYYVKALNVRGEAAINKWIREEQESNDKEVINVRNNICKTVYFQRHPVQALFEFSNLARAALKPTKDANLLRIRQSLLKLTVESVQNTIYATMRKNNAELGDFEVTVR